MRYIIPDSRAGRAYPEIDLDFETLEAAKVHANNIARGVAKDGNSYRGLAICIFNELGTEMGRVLVP